MWCGVVWCDQLWLDVMRCGATWWHVLCVYVLRLNFSICSSLFVSCSGLLVQLVHSETHMLLSYCTIYIILHYRSAQRQRGETPYTAAQQCSNSVLLLVSSGTAFCWSAARKLFITAGQQCASSLLLLVNSGLTHLLLLSSAERTSKPLTHSCRLGAQQSPDLLEARLAGPGNHGQCLLHRTSIYSIWTIIYSKSTLSWQHDTWWEGKVNMWFLIEQFVVIDKTA